MQGVCAYARLGPFPNFRRNVGNNMGISRLLTADDAAAFLGIKRRTVDSYRSRRNFPAPDRQLGKVPLWRQSTLTEWAARRPGRGVGGGRPAHKPKVKAVDAAVD